MYQGGIRMGPIRSNFKSSDNLKGDNEKEQVNRVLSALEVAEVNLCKAVRLMQLNSPAIFIKGIRGDCGTIFHEIVEDQVNLHDIIDTLSAAFRGNL